MKKSNLFKTVIILSFLAIFSCQFTQSFQPDFNSKQATVLDSIKTKYGFKDITFIGKKQTGSGGVHSSLTIKFINGENIPADDEKMTDLAKLLGTQIKSIVKTPEEFDTYIVLFDTVVVKKGSLGDVTNENYTGHEFKTAEL